MSIFSMNCCKYDGMTDEEKKQKIQEICHQLAEEKKKNNTNPLTLEYYLAKGLSEHEARAKLKERQSTFSLEKCIERYGEVEGRRRFDERQKKWQDTLNSKPVEEIERISKCKMGNGCGYSKISQKLFDEIVAQLGQNKFSEIFYATNGQDSCFNEYMVYDPATSSQFFLDFYVKDNNKVIEFDGDYWHGEKRGCQEYDREREQKLRELGYVNIMRVRERDYKNNPDEVVQECLSFIRKQV